MPKCRHVYVCTCLYSNNNSEATENGFTSEITFFTWKFFREHICFLDHRLSCQRLSVVASCCRCNFFDYPCRRLIRLPVDTSIGLNLFVWLRFCPAPLILPHPIKVARALCKIESANKITNPINLRKSDTDQSFVAVYTAINLTGFGACLDLVVYGRAKRNVYSCPRGVLQQHHQTATTRSTRHNTEACTQQNAPTEQIVFNDWHLIAICKPIATVALVSRSVSFRWRTFIPFKARVSAKLIHAALAFWSESADRMNHSPCAVSDRKQVRLFSAWLLRAHCSRPSSLILRLLRKSSISLEYWWEGWTAAVNCYIFNIIAILLR